MAGVCRFTGKMIQEPAHIRHGIDVILTTPVGSRVMLREFGFDGIGDECRGKPGLNAAEVRALARAALEEYEPRATFGDLEPKLDGAGVLQAIVVNYVEKTTGDPGQVRVIFPPAHMRK